MALCINQSGTWREITTQCVNDSGTWRKVATGCINQSGSWRCYGFFSPGDCPLGSFIEGGYLICKSFGSLMIVAPASTEVSRNWYCRDDAVTTAQANAACGDWFVPICAQLQDPGYTCRTYWDSYSSYAYWSSTEAAVTRAFAVYFSNGTTFGALKPYPGCVRAFRCIAY